MKGYVQVYTGGGKGKTTAALGLAFRAVGHGFKTCIIQFMKGQDYGELQAAKKLAPYITIEQFGKKTFVHIEQPGEEDIRMAREGLRRAKEVMASGEYDILVLDEINVALYYRLLPLEEVINVIKSKPENLELILTGRYAPQEIIELADLVTEMREVKHYYRRGVRAREGIER